MIEAAITYSLSEDEESCDIILSPNTDIENQFSDEELKAQLLSDKDEATLGTMKTKETAGIVTIDPGTKSAIESSTTKNQNDKSMTFTHLEIMRNELARIMEIAQKDKEICELKERAEEIQEEYARILASKDAEISRIESSLNAVESNLLLVQQKLASEEMEHSKTIEVLMETQYNYHELSGKSWFEPLFCFV